jgi:hypothetical protein
MTRRAWAVGAMCAVGFAVHELRIPDPRPLQQTEPEISENDLRARLSVFAHDSMEGRRTGTRGHARATAYVISELARLRAMPAGERGLYTQTLPLRRYQLDVDSARIIVTWDRWAGNLDSVRFHTRNFVPGFTFLPLLGELGFVTPLEARVPRESVLPLVYGGRLGDSNAVEPRRVRGAAVMFSPPLRRNGQPGYDLWPVRDHLVKYREAALIFVATFDLMPRSVIARLSGERIELMRREVDLQKMPPIVAISRGVLTYVTDVANESHSAAAVYTSHERAIETQADNVIAVVEGSDPQLRSEYVLVSAHTDHRGMADSAEQGPDRVYNGADGGGSGAVALLELAEHIAAMPTKPKRSIALIWTAGHDQSFLGGEYFIDHPTIPRGRIAASISIDRLGRGDTIEVTGARRLSTELSAVLDSAIAGTGHPQRATPADRDDVCSGDDWNYARRGVPSALVTGGTHADLYSVRDDTNRVRFASLAANTELVLAMIERVANRGARPRIDKPDPDPRRPCVM